MRRSDNKNLEGFRNLKRSNSKHLHPNPFKMDLYLSIMNISKTHAKTPLILTVHSTLSFFTSDELLAPVSNI